MGYKVKLTDYAIRQMQDIVSYISKILLVPDVALGWSDKIKNEIANLSYLPSRFPFVEDEPWYSEGVHKMVVENFDVYYWIDEASATVWITGIIYQGQDQIAALRRMPKMG